MPTNTGMPAGAVDGAFERFLTAAIATIITIMFSWRLLTEEEEAAARTQGGQPPIRAPVQYTPREDPSSGNRKDDLHEYEISSVNIDTPSIDVCCSSRSQSTDVDRIDREHALNEHIEPAQAMHLEAINSPVNADDMSFNSQNDDSLTDETLTTWDEYKWEEEMGQEEKVVIKTRRNVRDFITSPSRNSESQNASGTNLHLEIKSNDNSLSNDNLSPNTIHTSPDSASSPVLTFAQRFANFEYKDNGGDSGYIDLYPDVDSDEESDSSDDEHVYEIQVSDSDSDSPDDNGGRFYGIKSLDTIFEDDESDASDNCDKETEHCDRLVTGAANMDRYDANDKDKGAVYNDKAHSPMFSKLCQEESDVNMHDHIESAQNQVQNSSKPNEIRQLIVASTQAETESRLPPAAISKQTDGNISLISKPLTECLPTEVCKASVSNPSLDNPSYLLQGENETRQISDTVSRNNDGISTERENTNPPSTFRIELAKLQNKMKPLKSKQFENDYNISELSDDSLPSSPIRTCALGDDGFSDTESCSSESVITVVSVKSSDNDSYIADRYDVTRNNSIRSATREGNSIELVDHLSHINDDASTQDNNSLVSGFLNDSLNSLLSANTDTESDFGYDRNNGNTSCIVSPIEEINDENLPEETEIDMQAEQKSSVIHDTQDQTQSVNQDDIMNGHAEVDDYKKYNDVDNIPEQANLEWQNDTTNFESDSSSDSSDPPLREYDPDEDDLAAFQFNLDSDDDSLYLVVGDEGVGDEGKLRNFDTFTNLNSVGLSPEYGDAVTSQTVSDDASGFKFSQTQEIDTKFHKRSYFTDRCNLSDSDTRSNPLSPITSEDEESRASDKPVSESLSELDDNSSGPRVDVASTYSDAELSNSASISESMIDRKQGETGDIDFQKYIIYSEKSLPSESAPHSDELKEISGRKDVQLIDKDAEWSNNITGSPIDLTAVKIDNSGAKDINNERERNVGNETVSSITEKIRSLSVDDDYLDYVESDYTEAVPRDISRKSEDTRSQDIFIKQEIEPIESSVLPETAVDYISNNDLHAVPKRETNIDDIFLVENNSKNRTEETVENKVTANRTSSDASNSKLTDKEYPQSVRVASTQSRLTHSKVETNIDDVLDDDALSYKRQHDENNFAQSEKGITETNVDDILYNSSSSVQEPHASSPTHHKHSIETSVDDIFNNKSFNSNKLQRPRKNNADRESEIVSYESFVDDLHDKNSTTEAERVHCIKSDILLNNVTSESVEHKHRGDDSDLGSGRCSVKTLSIERETESQASHDQSRVNTDNGTKIYTTNSDVNTDNETTETIAVILQSGSVNDNEQPETSIINRVPAQKQPPVTSYRVKPQQSPIATVDGTEVCDRNNRQSPDNVTDRRKNVDNASNTKSSSKQPLLKCDDETESGEAIITPVNASKISSEWTDSTPHKSDLQKHKDYNANVALPGGKFSNIAKNNHSKLGINPDQNDKNNYTGNAISVNEHSLSDTSQTEEDDENSTDIASCDDIDLGITDVANKTSAQSLDTSSSLESSSVVSGDDDSLSSIEDSLNSLQSSYNSYRLRGLSESAAAGRVVRASVTKPSEFFGKTKEYQGVKKKVHKHQLKKYTSILQQPVNPENKHISVPSPAAPPSISRLKITHSRQRFLSAENLSNSGFDDKFLQHRTSLVTSTPRKYLKRHERSLTDLNSTESLPANMANVSYMSAGYGINRSMDGMLQEHSHSQFQDLYASRYSSTNTSYDRADYDKLHANCMFSPQKREEIRHTTKSLENMFEQLLRYGSVSSLETDIDAYDASQDQSLHDTDIIDYVSFQYPLERAASMSALTGSSDRARLPRKPGKGRFANRLVPKSKSLQTLETNLDDVFAQEDEISGELKRTPSVHELRVTKSLSKLAVPDWFKKSSFSRSGSTQSLFTYAGRQGSTSTLGSCAYPPSGPASPSPSVTPSSNAVIIQKRVTPSPTTPSARLLRAPMLPTTPEKSPIHATPSVGLPSDRFRKNDKKELKPIAIVPFAKLREMFEKKSVSSSTSPVTSPTTEKPPSKVRFEAKSPTTESNPIHSISKETVTNSRLEEQVPAQNHRTISPPPPIPQRKPIAAEHIAKSENVPQQNAQTRRTQVHFSDEPHVSRSQEQNKNSVRHNGATPSEKNSTIKKPQSLRTSLPMPQFRFRRPGMFATKASPSVSQNQGTQSKKGKDCNTHGTDNYDNDEPVDASFAWLHALEMKAKYDGETLFEFLQKRRYSSLLENGFAEQMEELQDREVAFNFPVLSLGKHSNNGIGPMDRSPDLQVILTSACSNQIQKDYLINKLRREAPVDDILDGLLLLNGHSTGKMKLDENGCIVPRDGEDGFYSPDTPPGLTLNIDSSEQLNGCVQNGDEEFGNEYTLVKCENTNCNRETNLREAKKCFKTCHSCYSYYCSRSCRKVHWEAHKKVCVYSRINSACKHVIKFINRQPQLQYQCSRIARRGYLSQGRGCVLFAFPDISSSEDFLCYGMDSLWVPPVYVSLKDLHYASMLGNQLELLSDTCKQYSPELKYVIHVAIVIPPRLPVRPMPRRMEPIIQKCAKLRLSPAHMHPKQDNSDIPSTLILTAVPGNQHISDVDGRKTRELCFINIQRKLRNRGVSLRHQFPEVYNRLIDFVADSVHFSPLIIYPVDSRSGKKFMCVIMPEAEPEIEWIRDPGLFHELDVFDEDEADISTPNLSQHELHEVLL